MSKEMAKTESETSGELTVRVHYPQMPEDQSEIFSGQFLPRRKGEGHHAKVRLVTPHDLKKGEEIQVEIDYFPQG